MLKPMWDEREFLSDYGVRSLSKFHELSRSNSTGQARAVRTCRVETKLKGGNSNWRGRIWFPASFLIIESLRKLSKALGPDYAISTKPHGTRVTLAEMSESLAGRLIAIFARGSDGRRPVYGGTEKFQHDPHWRDLLLFYEYFHGDDGGPTAPVIRPVGPHS